MQSYFYFFFFFSSRRRHTRWPRDWSSDVCSSDLISMFKETPFLSFIFIGEMVRQAVSYGGNTFRYTEPLTMAGLIFLAASYPTAVLIRELEKKRARAQPGLRLRRGRAGRAGGGGHPPRGR